MTRLRLLGGPAEDISCTVISGGPEEDIWDKEHRLRAEAKLLQAAWYATPEDANSQAKFANLLLEWGQHTSNHAAIEQALRLGASQ